MSTVEQNISARREAEAMIELCGDQTLRFWQVVAELATAKLPKPEPQPERYPPMTDVQAMAFENMLLPYGKYRGWCVRDVESSYLIFLTEGDEFHRDLKRYVRSKRFAQVQNQDDGDHPGG